MNEENIVKKAVVVASLLTAMQRGILGQTGSSTPATIQGVWRLVVSKNPDSD